MARWFAIVCLLVAAAPARASVCISALVKDVQVDGCGELRHTNGTWSVPTIRARIVVPARSSSSTTIGAVSVVAMANGDLTGLAFEARGEARIPKVELRTPLATVTFRDLRLPFDVRVSRAGGSVRIVPRAPLAVSIGSATIEAHGASVPIHPTVTIEGAWPSWRARISWAAMPLGPVVAAVSNGRVTGTGLVDGEIIVHGDHADVTLARGAIRARDGGTLALGDHTVQEQLAANIPRFAIHQRVAAALADFGYTELAASLGGDPSVRVTLRGRGRRVPQDLDVVVNLRSQR